MIKTTLTKLKKAYSTLSFAPRALGLETNGKFYKLIVSLLRRADNRTKPDKTEEEYERGEVIAKLMLEPSDTTAIFSRGLSKPEALQKSSFLAPPVDKKQREKSTFSDKDESEQNDLNKPVCNLQEVAESKSLPHSIIQHETRENEAPHTDTETHKQKTVFSETKKIDPPNSLENAIPDIILDKNYFDGCPDGKTTDTILCSPGKENSNGNIFNNLQNSTGPVEVNNTIHSKPSAFIERRFYDRDNDSPYIKYYASYDKTKKPPSTETNTSLDEIAKHCLDSPNNKIDERLLKEMKKLGVPQTSPRSENSVIEENIIQMDVLRKPRKPTEKTEIDVETRKFEHPPLNYSDEQRLEFEPRTAEEEELVGIMEKDKKQTSCELASQFCNVGLPTVDNEKPLLNPFDKRKIKLDDESSSDAKEAINCYHTKAPGVVKLEKTNEPLKCSLVNSRSYHDKTDKPLEFHKLSENEADKKCIKIHKKNSNNPTKLSMISENNVENTISTNAYSQPKSEQDSTKPSEGIVDNVTISSTPLKITNTVDYQPKAEQGLSEQSEKKLNYTFVSQDAPSVADEPHQMYTLTDNKVHATKISSTSSKSASCVDFQAEGELAYDEQQFENKSVKMVNQETAKRPKLENICCDPVPKKPEPFLVFDPPEPSAVKLNIRTNQKEFITANDDLETKHDVAFIQPLKSLRIRCNVLPTKNTDEKATISLLVEIDAYKQPKEDFLPRNEPDVTYTEESADHQNYLKKMNHITNDKITLILPEKQEKPKEAQADSIPEAKPEIPLSEMLKRVRSRNRAEYCQQLEKTLEHELSTGVETITGKCGDKKPRCPPRCPPSKRSRCPSPCTPPPGRPACPRPCKPAGPPPCPPPCPRTTCPPCRRKQSGSPCCPGSSRSRGGNPCCPGSSRSKGGNPCCPGSSRRKGGNPCCPGSSSGNKGGNPCCPGSSSSPRNPCKFSTHLPSIMMNCIVSLIDQRLTFAQTELAQNQLFMVTKDAYQRFLYSACFAEFYRPHLLPILNICGINASLSNCESMNSNLARDYDPWVPIPCWPVPKKEAKKPLICPKGCPIPLPGKNRPTCNPYPCHGFPKRKNSFSIIDFYACWSNPNGRQ